MRIIHDSLEIETGFKVSGVEAVCLEEEFNAHGRLSVTFFVQPGCGTGDNSAQLCGRCDKGI